MTGFNHTLAGALAAVLLPAALAPVVALASHFALDSLPHFGRDPRIVPYNKAFVGMLIVDAVFCFATLGLSVFLFPSLWWLIIICTAAATLPDFLWGIKRWAPAWLTPQYVFHQRIQWGERPYGWIFEVTFFVIALSCLVYLAR